MVDFLLGILVSSMLDLLLFNVYLRRRNRESKKCSNVNKARYYHKDNKAFYTVLVDLEDELVLCREDVNIRILMSKDNFNKYLKLES